MRNLVGRISGPLFAIALLLTFGSGRAEAQSVWWPYADLNYSCDWEKPDPANPGQLIEGTSTIQFYQFAGNDYLRRGYLRTWYPSGGFSEVGVTVTKPVNCGADCTSFELTTSSGVQCKNFRVFNFRNNLFFDECSNGALQWCHL